MSAHIEGVEGLQSRLRAIGGRVIGKPIMTRLAMRTVREAKMLAPRRTSNLSRSIHVLEVTENAAIVVASAEYASAVEFGSREHDIVPVYRKALRWANTAAGTRLTGSPRMAAQRGGLGGVSFAKKVTIPAQPPHPFMRPGAMRALEREHLTDLVVEAWNRAG
jgi:phage gpG-like protein